MIVEISPSVRVGADQKLLLIAGPCQIESREHCLSIAEFLRKKPSAFLYHSSLSPHLIRLIGPQSLVSVVSVLTRGSASLKRFVTPSGLRY